MNANSTSTSSVSQKLVDSRTHVNMTKLLERLEVQRKARNNVPAVAQPAPRAKPAIIFTLPPVLRPTFTKSQLIILDDIEETLAGF